MSRLSLLLVLALSSAASADRAYVVPVSEIPEAHFAQPPAHVFDRAAVRSALAKARAQNLDRFRAYQKRGVFPSNTFSDDKLNVWRDDGGHLCAAATIIDGSGQHDLVTRVAEQNNFIRLADVRQGPLMDWILTSGFTQDEIAAIQEPFSPVLRPHIPDVIDPDLRTAENQRLRVKYAAVTRMLLANEAKSLDAATDRIMRNRELAWQLVNR